MAAVVLDASVTLAWALPDEAGSAAAHAIFLRVGRDAAIVPMTWRTEVGNGLLSAERRKRILRQRINEVSRNLSALPIEIDAETNARAWNASMDLARRHALTLYDAVYLELALRRGVQLATFDAALARAALAEKIGVATPSL